MRHWQADHECLRAALAPITAEPLPPELSLQRRLATRPARSNRLFAWTLTTWRLPRWTTALVATLLLSLGGLSGWTLHGYWITSTTGGLMALAHEAAASYRVYAPDTLRPVELRADERELLTNWASERTGHTITIPDLSVAGYRYMGGRVLASRHGAAVLLMYDDDQGSRLVILARPMAGTAETTPMTPWSLDTVRGFAWHEAGLGYSLAGTLATPTLHQLANAMRAQLEDHGQAKRIRAPSASPNT